MQPKREEVAAIIARRNGVGGGQTDGRDAKAGSGRGKGMPNDDLGRMAWRIVLRAQGAAPVPLLPSRIVTLAPRFRHHNMPDEVALLLPANHGPMDLISAVTARPDRFEDAILGLFLSNPFFNIERETAQLARAGIRWIANLPSVGQQDEEFSRQLSDVNLDEGREFATLREFGAAGFRVAVVVADAAGARGAIAIEPDMIIVLPRIAAFAAGFPSLRQRRSAALEVYEEIGGHGWRGPLLCLAEEAEAGHETLWPSFVDGVLCRPALVAPDDAAA